MTSNAAAGTVGFIGLGTMGREMAVNLMKAGHRVQAFDVRREAVDEPSRRSGRRRAHPSPRQPAAPTS